MPKEGCASVAYGSTSHMPTGVGYLIQWLPKGYGPSLEDKMVLFIPDVYSAGADDEEPVGLSRGERHPLVEAVANAVENYFREQARKALS